jgi:hypothetical protein
MVMTKPKVPTAKRGKSKISKPDQAKYATQLLSLINVARQIRAGKAEKLAEQIESSLPDYLRQMADFEEVPPMRAPFYLSRLLYDAIGKKFPEDLRPLILKYGKAEGVLSDDCFALKKGCGGVLCWKDTSSLQPVDTSKKDPYGWRYVIGTSCGWELPTLRKPCGPPLNGPLCDEDVVKF